MRVVSTEQPIPLSVKISPKYLVVSGKYFRGEVMSRKNRKPSQKPVAELLEGFTEDKRRIIGASDSAHKLVVGTYNDQEVAIKPFRSKKGVTKARNEFAITNAVAERGFPTPEPVEVKELKRQLVTLLISKYIANITGAHTH